MKMIVWMTLLSTLVSTEVSTEIQFPGLVSLVGRCYQATFPDSEKIDTHCFSELYEGQFIVDDHLVCGDGNDYQGKTIYAIEAKSKNIIYRYYNSLGGFSDGSVRYADGHLQFPEETYQQADGPAKVYRTIWQLKGGSYVSMMDEKVADNQWQPIWKMNFKIVKASNMVTEFNEKGQMRCLVGSTPK